MLNVILNITLILTILFSTGLVTWAVKDKLDKRECNYHKRDCGCTTELVMCCNKCCSNFPDKFKQDLGQGHPCLSCYLYSNFKNPSYRIIKKEENKMSEVKDVNGNIVSYGSCYECGRDTGMYPKECDGEIFCSMSCVNSYQKDQKEK